VSDPPVGTAGGAVPIPGVPDRPLRVGLNLTWLVPGVVGGSEDYVVGLLDALAHGPAAQRLRSVAEPVLFVNRSFAPAHPRLAAAFEAVVAPVSGASKLARVAADNSWLPVALRRHRLDAVHHLGGVVPFVGAGRRAGRARLLCVHDLQPLDLPANFSWLKRRFEAAAIPWSVRHSDVITTLGDWVAGSVAARFDVPPDRFALVPPGATRPTTQGDGDGAAHGDGPATADDAILDRLGLGGAPYVVYPAITYPHKNHAVLVDALARLANGRPSGASGTPGGPPPIRLVLTGGSAAAEDALAERIAAAGLGRWVVRPGRVSGRALTALYRGATAMVFPSRYEGFGLPVLEAMQLGCPVVVADACALPGVVNGAGVVVDPDDPDAWATAIADLLDDPARRARLVDAGHERAATFTWDAGAEALVAAWQQGVARVAGTAGATSTSARSTRGGAS
jgi:glycosyltransferase involved in cell wall biosynthesis